MISNESNDGVNNAQQQTFMNLNALPRDVLSKLTNQYLSVSETLSLALAYGKQPLARFLLLSAKKRRLNQLGNIQLTLQDPYVIRMPDYLAVEDYESHDQFEYKGVFAQIMGPLVRKKKYYGFNNMVLNLSATDDVKQFISASTYSLLLTKEGRCFRRPSRDIFPYHRPLPVELDIQCLKLSVTDKIKHIITGSNHSILLTEEGRWFMWGDNSHGQLGLGDNEDRNMPVEFDIKRLNLSATDKIKQIIAGSNHTILLTEEGRCFVWGANDKGQLGLGDNEDRNTPVELDIKRLNLSATDKIKQIIAGSNHTILLTEEGRCFVWGANNQGQLGLGDYKDRNEPVEFDIKRLGLHDADKIKQVIANSNYSILLTEQSRCFAWGGNFRGVLDLSDNVNRPDPVERFPADFKARNLLIKSIVQDLSQIVYFAKDNSEFGKYCYQLLMRNLSFETKVNRLLFLPALCASPWHDPQKIAQLIPHPWLWEKWINKCEVLSMTEQLLIAEKVCKLLSLYDYFIYEKPSNDQEGHLNNFMELLEKLQNKELVDSQKVADWLHQSAASKLLKNSFQLSIFASPLNESSPTNYYNLCQKLLIDLQQNPAQFDYLKAAAEIMLAGIKSMMVKDNITFDLQSLIHNPLEQNKLAK